MADLDAAGDRRSSVRAIAAIVAVVALFGGAVAWDPTRSWFDDPWFYLQIARHVVAGDGVTFNGFGPTNGFHPLWMLFAVPIVAVAGPHGLAAAQLAVAVQVVFAVVAALGLLRATRRAELPYPVAVLGLAGTVFLSGGAWGSEGFLNLALQCWALALWVGAKDVRAHAAAGVVLGLAVLARLDLVFLAAAVCAGTLVRPGDRVRHTLALGLAITAVLTPYLVLNWATTGHLMPVSGAVKSTFPHPDPSDLVAKLGVVGRNALVGGVLAVVLGAVRRGPSGALLAVVGAGALGHVAYVALFTAPRWSTDYDYYYMTGLLALSLCGGPLFEAVARGLPSLDARAKNRVAAVIAGVLLLTGAQRVAVRLLEPRPSTVALAEWLGANLPDAAVLFTADAPGRLSWFSERRVLAVDGLTDDFGLSERLATRGLDGWLDDHGVTHVVTPLYDYRVPWLDNRSDGAEVAMTVLDPWTGNPAGTLELERTEAIVTTEALDPASEPVGVWLRPSAR